MKKFNALYGKLIAEMTETDTEMTVCDHIADKMYDPRWINPMYLMHSWYKMIFPDGTKKEFKSASLSVIQGFLRNQIKNGNIKIEDVQNKQICIYQWGTPWSADNKLVSEGGKYFNNLEYKPLGAFVLKDNMKLYWKPYTYTGSDAITKEEADKLEADRKADVEVIREKMKNTNIANN